MRAYELPIYKVQLVKDGNQISSRKQINSPVIAADILKVYIGEEDREHFMVIMLNTKNRIIGINTVSIGSLSATIIHPREVFKPAILCNAAGIIISHNHPSGDPKPSKEDLAVTRKIKDAAFIMGIELKDHIIIGEDCFFSFAEKGLI